MADSAGSADSRARGFSSEVPDLLSDWFAGLLAVLPLLSPVRALSGRNGKKSLKAHHPLSPSGAAAKQLPLWPECVLKAFMMSEHWLGKWLSSFTLLQKVEGAAGRLSVGLDRLLPLDGISSLNTLKRKATKQQQLRLH